MAILIIAGRTFDLAPLSLGLLRQAAPYMDRINARATLAPDDPTIAQALNSTEEIVAVLGLATARIDPMCTAEWINDNATFKDMSALAQSFTDLVTESGLGPSTEGNTDQGEAQAPATPAGA